MLSALPRVGILAVIALVVVAVAAVFVIRPLGPRRVARFAERQHLVLDADNRELVISALAISHVWRRFGVLAGVALGIVVAVVADSHTFNFVWVFVGWFAGAVVGEWRIVAPIRDEPRRSAEVAPRSVGRYVTANNRVILWIFAGLLVLTAAAAGVAGLAAAGSGLGGWALWCGGSVLVAGLLWLTMRRVLQRRGSLPTESLRQADDALRAQALAVLAGSSIALSCLAIGEFISQIASAYAPQRQDGLGGLGLVVMAVSLAVGWHVASRSASVRARQQVRPESGQVGAA